MLVTTIALAVLAAAGLVGWRVVKGGSGSSRSAAGTWDRIALVDRTTGAITTIDDSGQVDATIVGSGRATDVHAYGAQIGMIGIDRITIVDTHDPTAEPTLIPFERGNTVTPVSTTGSSYLVVGNPTGGNVLIVDVGTGNVIDVFAAADPVRPLIFPETLRWAADGSAFAVADAANFQTILVQPGVPGAVFLSDQPVAVGDELVATSETVGLQANIALVDHQAVDPIHRCAGFHQCQCAAGGVVDVGQLERDHVDVALVRIDDPDFELPLAARVDSDDLVRGHPDVEIVLLLEPVLQSNNPEHEGDGNDRHHDDQAPCDRALHRAAMCQVEGGVA